MALNAGYLKSENTSEAQEMYTPYYAVEPILKYIPKDKKIWCPFDKEWSAFVQMFTRQGYFVQHSHIDEGGDFFQFSPQEYDIIVSNPPFKIKDRILQRLYELNKPFAILLPLNSLQGVSRHKYFKRGIQILAFDQRIGYHNIDSMEVPIEGSPFATAYFCRDVLPKDLIVEHIEKYEKPLMKEGAIYGS